MSDDKILKERGRALEEQFFAKHNQDLLNKLRAEGEAESKRTALAAASGVSNDALLEQLIEAGITAESFAALSLAPLVAVAWADGEIQSKERAAAIKAAQQSGIRPQDPAYALLTSWLDHRPDADFLETWKEYAKAFHSSIEPAMSSILQKEILGRARRIAESAGGFLGIGSISAEEKNVLEDLESAFS